MSLQIITDSSCDLPVELLEVLNIKILPIVVIKDEVEYLDKVDIMPEDIYRGMENGDLYKTAQVPPKIFEETFEELAKNKQEALYLAFSSGLSGTYQTSILIRDGLKDRYPEMDINIVDCCSAALGQGLIVLKAAEMLKEGSSRDSIINMVEFYKKHLEHIITVDDIDYLYKGGRISKTEAFVGGLLNIKPIIEMTEDGKLQAFDKVRGQKKALKRILEVMEERSKEADLSRQTIGITYGIDETVKDYLEKEIKSRFKVKDIVVANVGSAIAAHTGPKMTAVFFLNEDYK